MSNIMIDVQKDYIWPYNANDKFNFMLYYINTRLISLYANPFSAVLSIINSFFEMKWLS